MKLHRWSTLPGWFRKGLLAGLIAVPLVICSMPGRNPSEIIQEVPQFTAYRVDGTSDDVYPEDHQRIRHWPVLETRQVEAGELSDRIRSVLASADTYGGNGPTTCFFPGMAFRFADQETTLDVLICLDCNYAYFYVDETRLHIEDLSPQGNAALLAIYRELFPETQRESAEQLP